MRRTKLSNNYESRNGEREKKNLRNKVNCHHCFYRYYFFKFLRRKKKQRGNKVSRRKKGWFLFGPLVSRLGEKKKEEKIEHLHVSRFQCDVTWFYTTPFFRVLWNGECILRISAMKIAKQHCISDTTVQI